MSFEPALQVRRADEADVAAIAAVHFAAWEETYRGLLPDHIIDSRTLERRIDTWRAAVTELDRMTFVCTEDRVVVGFASALAFSLPHDGFQSYLQSVYLRSTVKRRGIGRALLRAVARELILRGCTNMALRVLSKNPARAFYERLNARFVPEGISYDAGIFHDDVVYAFDDLNALLTA